MSPVLSRISIGWKTAICVPLRTLCVFSLKPGGIKYQKFSPLHDLNSKHTIWRGIRGQSAPNSSASNGQKLKLNPQNVFPGERLHPRMLGKPFMFTILFSGISFAGATIWQYENVRKQAKLLFKHDFVKRQSFSYKQGTWRRELNHWWMGLTEGQKVAWGIIGLNALVFLMWRVPAFQPTMLRYFCTNPASKNVCLPMILSTFSHYSLLHCAMNMCVLYSFSSTAVAMFGKEQFVAMYLSAGVVSSFVSYVHKIATAQVGLSLGASGALMAVLGAVCLQYPDTQLALIFLPVFTFSAGMAIKTVIALDTAGLFLKWKFFDHAAHLGGVLFGMLYLMYGQDHIWARRVPLMELWHDFREDSKK